MIKLVLAAAPLYCADVDGFSLHADVCVPARDRAQLERLCRYVARPAIASERLELLDHEPRADDPAPDVESSARSTATGARGLRSSRRSDLPPGVS